MNILFLCDEYPPCQHGGIGSVIQNLARELVQKGHHVSVCGFYPYYRKALSFEIDFGVNIYRIFYGNRLLLKLSKHKLTGKFINIESKFNAYTKFLKEFIKKNKIEIIEIPDFNEAFRYSGPRFIKFPDFDIPSVIKIHGTFSFFDHLELAYSFDKNIFNKEQYLIQNAGLVLAISEFSKKTVKEIINYSGDIAVIYNGISFTDSYSYKEDSDAKNVVFAGTLAEKKGILRLIAAWEKVISQIPSAKLLIYGRGGNKFIEKINSIISDRTKESIHILGFVTRETLSEVYRTASCTIFPSYAESFSMAPLESMLIGCPTIYTKRASGNELILNGINGLLVDPDDLQDIANAIIIMLSDRTSAQIMGKNGVTTIREKFNISSIADSHIKLYSSLIKTGVNLK